MSKGIDILINWRGRLMKKRYVVGVLIIVLGLLLFFTPFQIAHVCDPKPDGSFMKCHWMGEAVRLLGGLITVMGLLFVCFEKFSKGIAVSSILVAICQILLQFVVIGTCKTPTMSCNTWTRPTVIVLSSLLIIISSIYIVITRREN